MFQRNQEMLARSSEERRRNQLATKVRASNACTTNLSILSSPVQLGGLISAGIPRMRRVASGKLRVKATRSFRWSSRAAAPCRTWQWTSRSAAAEFCRHLPQPWLARQLLRLIGELAGRGGGGGTGCACPKHAAAVTASTLAPRRAGGAGCSACLGRLLARRRRRRQTTKMDWQWRLFLHEG